MSLRTRRLIFIIFLLAYFTITPLLILYAAGYKLSKTGFNFEKTGMFILDSNPRGAKIYINGKSQQSFLNKIFLKDNFITTPAKIKNLLPGEYDLRLELDGYWSWQKKLKINSGAATYAEDLYFFRKDLPISLINGQIKNFSFSPNKKIIAALTDKKIMLINVETGEEQSLDFAPALNNIILWSDDASQVMVSNSLFYSENLIKITGFNNNFFGFKWQGNKLYYHDKNNLYNYDLTDKTEKIILKNQPANDYLIKNNYAYLLTTLNRQTNLNIFNLDNEQLIRNINLPLAQNYEFINPSHHLINIYNPDQQLLYLIDPFSSFYPALSQTIKNVKLTYWVNNNKLIYANDFEIFLFDLSVGENTLITRISSKINNIIWHPSGNYIIYATDQSINTIELDEREKRNITELAKFDVISHPLINQAADMLYFYAKIGNQEGLYKLQLQ